jgi:multicomponent Na+:H+ antiporter subunit F
MVEVATTVALAVLSLASLFLLFRVVVSPTLADRIIALDSLLLSVVGGVAVHAARTGEAAYLNVMIVAALLAFLGTSLVARFVGRRDR